MLTPLSVEFLFLFFCGWDAYYFFMVHYFKTCWPRYHILYCIISISQLYWHYLHITLVLYLQEFSIKGWYCTCWAAFLLIFEGSRTVDESKAVVFNKWCYKTSIVYTVYTISEFSLFIVTVWLIRYILLVWILLFIYILVVCSQDSKDNHVNKHQSSKQEELLHLWKSTYDKKWMK